MKTEERNKIWQKWLRLKQWDRQHACPVPKKLIDTMEYLPPLKVCRSVCGPIFHKSGRRHHNCPCVYVEGGSREVARRVRAKIKAQEGKKK